MIRHGAQLAHAYAAATVPRVCVVLRKAYGGAYIVMDSKTMGTDLCLAWPTAEVAVMGAPGAVGILHRRTLAARARRTAANSGRARTRVRDGATATRRWLAAAGGYVDAIDRPDDTHPARLADALDALAGKRDRPPAPSCQHAAVDEDVPCCSTARSWS